MDTEATNNETPVTATPHISVIMHGAEADQHPQAAVIWAKVLEGLPTILEGVELVAPVIINAISAGGNQQLVLTSKS